MGRRLFIGGGIVVAVVLVVTGAGGYVVFGRSHQDPLRQADAIVVLGGEHDGREGYGLQLLRERVAPVLVLSDPYPPSDGFMYRICRQKVPHSELLCRKPPELTTGGEALLTRQLAAERGWKTVVVISWRFHLPRARLIFQKCFSDAAGALIMREVPRDYGYSLGSREFLYLYQGISIAANLMIDGCDHGAL
jgi:uncharacterized SAM-binding protein YcdF (DUF218 family)